MMFIRLVGGRTNLRRWRGEEGESGVLVLSREGEILFRREDRLVGYQLSQSQR